MAVVGERGSVRRARRDQKCARLAGTYGPGHCSMTLAGRQHRGVEQVTLLSTLLNPVSGRKPDQGLQ